MGVTILYVEDEQILGQLVAEALEKTGFDVQRISNGAEAIISFRTFEPHLCLLDIMLPGKDGYDVAVQIRQLDSRVPIIFLSAKIHAGDVIKGFKAGCNDYIRKPFSIEELTVRIDSWLKEKHGNNSPEEADEYEAGAYHFIPQKLLLLTPTGDITLTYKEAAILTGLFIHCNRPVSRSYLMQKAWNAETIYNSRSLDVYINRLRKYFNGSPNKIITLKGIGYRFITS